MKKQTALAVLLAFGLALSACGSKEKETTAKKTEKESAAIMPIETVKPIDLDSDTYNYYKEDTFFLPEKLYGYLSAMTEWDTELDISLKDNTFAGSYESRSFTLEGDAYDVLRCIFKGKIDGFKRVNEYSFSTHVTEFTTDKFEPVDEKYGEYMAHVTYSEPYGFKDADELILYLPNTPVSELPQKTIEWLEPYIGIPTPEHLGYYVICNKAEETAFVVYFQNDTVPGGMQLDLLYGIPDTTDPDPEVLKDWTGELVDNHLGARLIIDTSGSTPKASFERGSSVYKDLRVCSSKYGFEELILFGTEEHGFSVVLMLRFENTETKENQIIRCIESTDPSLRRGMKFSINKK
jgi:hypothetical protein